MRVVVPLLSARWRWALVGVLVTVVAVVSLVPVPGPDDPTPSGPLGFVGVDKWQHAAGYAILALAVAHARAGSGTVGGGRSLAGTFAATVGFGVVVEGLQALVATRTPDLADAAANAVGAAVALTAWVLLHRAGVLATEAE